MSKPIRPTPSDLLGQCHYCRRYRKLTRDHIIPACFGGPDGSWNIVPACSECNGDKADGWPTCQCEHCMDAVQYFLSDPQRRKKMRGVLIRRLEENAERMMAIEVARQAVANQRSELEALCALVADPIRSS